VVSPSKGDTGPIEPNVIFERLQMPGYEILQELGRGGMGVVYKAQQHKLNRIVALKMILAGGHASDADLARFLAEAEAIAQMQHPNVVQLFESGQHDGLPYFTLEFVSGGSLSQKLGGVPLPPLDAARLAEQLARGIHYAHQRGIIHRDLKPANVLLAISDQPSAVSLKGDLTADRCPLTAFTPKITDFGWPSASSPAAA
jgi:serine/threonine protein kinase